MKHLSILVIVLAAVLSGCNKEPLREVSKAEDTVKQELLLNPPWVYVMDFRYGRTCGPGGGVCFQNDWGDVWDYSWFYYGIQNPSNDDITNIHESEVGQELATSVIVLTNGEGGQYELHMLLTREGHEDGHVNVPFNYELTPSLSEGLGAASVTLNEGSYPIDNSEYPSFGKVVISCTVTE